MSLQVEYEEIMDGHKKITDVLMRMKKVPLNEMQTYCVIMQANIFYFSGFAKEPNGINLLKKLQEHARESIAKVRKKFESQGGNVTDVLEVLVK